MVNIVPFFAALPLLVKPGKHPVFLREPFDHIGFDVLI
jgi:hypothetical protein